MRKYFVDKWKSQPANDGASPKALDPPEWTVKNISEQFQPDELLYISVFNMPLWDFLDHDANSAGRLKRQEAFEDASPDLWIAYLDGQLDETKPAFHALPEELRHRFLALKDRHKSDFNVNLGDTLERLKERLNWGLLASLNDSVGFHKAECKSCN